MSLEMSPSRLESVSERPLINSELVTYPPDPLPLIREGGIMVSEGADAPSGFPFTIRYQKGVQEGRSPSQNLFPPLHDMDIYSYHEGD